VSDRNNSCSRCGQISYYEGHLNWCNAIQELSDRIEALEILTKINEPVPDIEEEASHMGGGEDASYHEWNFGHPYRGTILHCWTCDDKRKMM